MSRSEDPYRVGASYEARCENNGVKAALAVFAVFLGVILALALIAPDWLLYTLIALNSAAMLVAYAAGIIFTAWTEADDAEAFADDHPHPTDRKP